MALTLSIPTRSNASIITVAITTTTTIILSFPEPSAATVTADAVKTTITIVIATKNFSIVTATNPPPPPPPPSSPPPSPPHSFRYDLAKASTVNFFLLNPPQDQFYARILFVVAACDAQKALELELNGSLAAKQRVKALEQVLRALAIAQERPQYVGHHYRGPSTDHRPPTTDRRPPTADRRPPTAAPTEPS